MQAATASLIISPHVLSCAPHTSFSSKLPASTTTTSSRFASIRTNSLAVNYNSKISVFPAEACETIGGETCVADAYPEVKLKPEETSKPRIGLEPVEREYLDNADPRTVLLSEACDVLGGEFCEGPHQTGIFYKPSTPRR